MFRRFKFLHRYIHTYIPTRKPGCLSQYSDQITGLDEDGIRLLMCVGIFVFNIACIRAPWPITILYNKYYEYFPWT